MNTHKTAAKKTAAKKTATVAINSKTKKALAAKTNNPSQSLIKQRKQAIFLLAEQIVENLTSLGRLCFYESACNAAKAKTLQDSFSETIEVATVDYTTKVFKVILDHAHNVSAELEDTPARRFGKIG